jgi:hypothetical protein
MLFGRVEQVRRGLATEGQQNTDDTQKCINADEPIVNCHHTWSLSVLLRGYMAVVHCRPAVNELQQVDISLPHLSTKIAQSHLCMLKMRLKPTFRSPVRFCDLARGATEGPATIQNL